MWGPGAEQGGILQSSSCKLDLKEPYYRMSQPPAYPVAQDQQQHSLIPPQVFDYTFFDYLDLYADDVFSFWWVCNFWKYLRYCYSLLKKSSLLCSDSYWNLLGSYQRLKICLHLTYSIGLIFTFAFKIRTNQRNEEMTKSLIVAQNELAFSYRTDRFNPKI